MDQTTKITLPPVTLEQARIIEHSLKCYSLKLWKSVVDLEGATRMHIDSCNKVLAITGQTISTIDDMRNEILNTLAAHEERVKTIEAELYKNKE